jgi:hypothetical protein
MSWDSDGLQAGWLGFDSRLWNYFCFVHSVQTGSGVRPTSYPMATVADFPEGKAAGS